MNATKKNLVTYIKSFFNKFRISMKIKAEPC